MGCGGWLATVVVAMAAFLWEKNNPWMGRRARERRGRVQLILHAISKISGSTIDKGGEHQNETTPTLTIRGIHWSTIPVQFRPILNRL